MRTSRCIVFLITLLTLVHSVHAQENAAGTAGQSWRASYPEGPLWRDGRLYVAEMGADRVSVFHEGARAAFFSQRGCGPTAIAAYGAGFLVNCHLTGTLAQIDSRGAFVRRFDRTESGRRLRNPNDNTAGPDGSVFFSDPGPFSKDAPAVGNVVLLTRDGVVKDVAGPLWYPNGVFYDAGERALYVSEHLARKVWVYPVNADLSLGARRLFADIDRLLPKAGAYREAGPDGLERGPDGSMFVALYGEGRVLQVAQSGRLVRVIPVATPYVTNIAFGPRGRGVYVGAHQNESPPFAGLIAPLPSAPGQRTGR